MGANIGNEDKKELGDPAKYNIDNAVNVYFKGNKSPDDQIGGWFIAPDRGRHRSADNESLSNNIFQSQILSEDDVVILQIHGNAKNRGDPHRIVCYKKFQNLGYYSLTIDYRGFGDSTLSE